MVIRYIYIKDFSVRLDQTIERFIKPIFFLKNLFSSVTRYHGKLSSCAMLEKTNDPILRKFSDGQKDETDFIGCCPTKVERPINCATI